MTQKDVKRIMKSTRVELRKNLHAKINGIHIVYAVSGNKLIFLRAFKNFKRYEKFLEDKKAVKNLAKV